MRQDKNFKSTHKTYQSNPYIHRMLHQSIQDLHERKSTFSIVVLIWIIKIYPDFLTLILIYNIQGYGATGNQTSRLTQWKLPSLDKDGEGTDFSRAPGTAKSTTSPQLNQIGLQPDT